MRSETRLPKKDQVEALAIAEKSYQEEAGKGSVEEAAVGCGEGGENRRGEPGIGEGGGQGKRTKAGNEGEETEGKRKG